MPEIPNYTLVHFVINNNYSPTLDTNSKSDVNIKSITDFQFFERV